MQQTAIRQVTSEVMPPAMKVLMNHIYEYKKGVRRMILFTCNRRFEAFATNRLCRQSIRLYMNKVSIEDIMQELGRSRGGIISRLKRLGFVVE